MTHQLKLGPLPSRDVAKLTIVVPSTLRADLERYAKLHAEATGEQPDVLRLIPHMLAAFIHGDRGFRRAIKRPGPHAR